MTVERTGTSLIDVLDRVLDKGIVIDAWVRISLVGIDLITVEARIVVASIDTYLKYADAIGLAPGVSSRSAAALPAGREAAFTPPPAQRAMPAKPRARPAAPRTRRSAPLP